MAIRRLTESASTMLRKSGEGMVRMVAGAWSLVKISKVPVLKSYNISRAISRGLNIRVCQ